MDMLRQLQERYEAYDRETRELARKAPPSGGLFGLGEDPRKDPCHMRFYQDVEQWVADFRAAEPESREACQAVEWILMAAARRKGEPAYWFMYAAQGLCRELIGLLDPEDCARLRALYDGSYPRRDRLPVQKEIYKALRRGAGMAK